jgi:hypothetical protein
MSYLAVGMIVFACVFYSLWILIGQFFLLGR